MERDKRVFGEYKGGRRDNKNKKINKRVIIRNKNAKIYPKKDYVVILDDSEVILGYRYIEEFYIHKDSSLPLKYF